MFTVRRLICALSLTAALVILACMWAEAHPQRQPECYTSTHPVATMSPLMGFAADSMINSGDAKALDALPGIGAVIAQRIMDMREELCGFRLPEDLLLVKGIGEKTLDSILQAYPEKLVVLQELAD